MDFIKRAMAPITEKAWREIDNRMREVLKGNLYGRRVVKLVGPMGWEFSALPLGRVVVKSAQDESVQWGIRKVLPVIELRAPFTLDIWELDDIERGAQNVELGSLEDAAREVAAFEDEIVFYGCKDYGIEGIMEFVKDRKVTAAPEIGKIVAACARAVQILKKDGIEGPYDLLINSDTWIEMTQGQGFYQQLKAINYILEGGQVIPTPRIDAGLVVAKGDYFRLVIGQDFVVGYEGHNDTKVRLYITETLTFNVVNPLGVVGIDF